MGIMPSFQFELRCQERGEGRVAGIDEAGRGPLAGPVYAAAAVIDVIAVKPESRPERSAPA